MSKILMRKKSKENEVKDKVAKDVMNQEDSSTAGVQAKKTKNTWQAKSW